jgi:hypothetical protein
MIAGLVLEATMLCLFGNAYGFEGIGVATIAFWLPAMLIHSVAIKKLSFAWNRCAQLWTWAGVAACLSLRFGPVLFLVAMLIFLMTWREVRNIGREVISTFSK